jgi:hypothetical protein
MQKKIISNIQSPDNFNILFETTIKRILKDGRLDHLKKELDMKDIMKMAALMGFQISPL